MNRNVILLFTCFIFIGLLFSPGCKTTEEDGGLGQYTLTVSVGSGVSGTPAAGSYSYVENSFVNYNYSVQTGYKNLNVTLDGAAVASSGVITVTGNHVLNARADQIDIRGAWSGRAFYLTQNRFFRVEFSGGLDSGNCGGNFEFWPIGGAGTWTLTWPQINFTLHFPPPVGATLNCTGTLTDENNMNGSWLTMGIPGTWRLERL